MSKQIKTNSKPTATDTPPAVVEPRAKGALTAEAPNLSFEADGGQGMEGATAESFAIPFLVVLQSNSPQVDEASGRAIEGARAGMLYENVTGTLISGKPGDGAVIVPCAYRRVFLRWGPRSGEGAGFKGEYTPEAVASMRENGTVVEIDGRLYVPGADGEIPRARDGTILCDRLSDTRNHYVLLVDEASGGWQQALLSLTSTQIKKSKALMAALAAVKMRGSSGLFTPPTFANRVKVTTLAESNDKGNWFGLRMELIGFVEQQELYAAAKSFRDSVVKGSVEVKYEEPEPAHTEGGGF